MYIVNIKAEDIYLLNITPLELNRIYKWYNNEDFKYATGIGREMTIQQLFLKFIEVKESEEHFWLGIFKSSTDEMIGFIKGQIKHGANVTVWINLLIIDKALQNRGYGTKAVNLLINFVKKKSNLSKVYITVYNGNTRGYKFWESLGFKNCGRIEDYIVPEDKTSEAVLMCKLV